MTMTTINVSTTPISEESEKFAWFGMILFFVFILTAMFEVGLLVYAYFNADEVECNFLWCTFTDVREISVDSHITQTRDCFINGERVDCDRIPDKEHFDNGTAYTMNGVCGGDYESNLKCIEALTK